MTDPISEVSELPEAPEKGSERESHEAVLEDDAISVSSQLDDEVGPVLGALLRAENHAASTVHTSLEEIQRMARVYQKSRSVAEEQREAKVRRLPVGEVGAEEQLSLVVQKEDFRKMNIVGQFNNGFILATQRTIASEKNGRQTLQVFIIDQHASDEKYNFERLQASTEMQSQPLVRQLKVDLTPVETLLVHENQDIVRRNGFAISIDDNSNDSFLTALPVCRGVVFRVEDFMELLREMQSGSLKGARCSKARRVFASRACRSSVMIGRVLSLREMRTIVDHLGDLHQPWNCPHGRPTMRHLVTIR
jgi:DNA mismatch repair protein PMS2